MASALLEHAQAGRARADPVARITGLLSPRKGFSERHRVLRELALQFSRRQHPGVQVTAARICPDTLSASAVLGLGPNLEFFQHLFLWKFRLKMRTMVDLEKIIWRTSKVFVFGNGYNIVLAIKPVPTANPRQLTDDGESVESPLDERSCSLLWYTLIGLFRSRAALEAETPRASASAQRSTPQFAAARPADAEVPRSLPQAGSST